MRQFFILLSLSPLFPRVITGQSFDIWLKYHKMSDTNREGVKQVNLPINAKATMAMSPGAFVRTTFKWVFQHIWKSHWEKFIRSYPVG